ncbi:uncharacterized protein FA14DRAFT_171480, partial [Meira miltonrushii]
MATPLSSDMKEKWKLLANFIAYKFCFEYDLAIEEGLRKARRHSDLQAKDDVDQTQAVRAIFACVDSAVKEAQENFPKSDFLAEAQKVLEDPSPEVQSKYAKEYIYTPDLKMNHTFLHEKYHPTANLIITEVFSHYQKAVEKGKVDALTEINIDNTIFQSPFQELYDHISKNCIAVRVDVDALLKTDSFRAYPSQPLKSATVKSTSQSQPGSSKPSTFIDLTLDEDEDENTVTQDQNQQKSQASETKSNSTKDSSKVFYSDEIRKRTRAARYSGDYRKYYGTEEEEDVQANHQRRKLDDSVEKAPMCLEKVELGKADDKAPLLSIEEILGKSFVILLGLKENATPALQMIMNHYSRDTIVQAIKAGMTSDAQKFITSLVNGDQMTVQALQKMVLRQVEQDKVSKVGIILFFQEGKLEKHASSLSDIHASFVAASTKPTSSLIATAKGILQTTPLANELLGSGHGLGNERNTHLCFNLWSLNETVEALGIFEVDKISKGKIWKPHEVKRAFMHFARCLFMVSCWTVQNDEKLNQTSRHAFPRCQPPLGLHDRLPLSSSYHGKITNEQASSSGSTNVKSHQMPQKTSSHTRTTNVPPARQLSESSDGEYVLSNSKSKSNASSNKPGTSYEDKVQALLSTGYKCLLRPTEIPDIFQGSICLSPEHTFTFTISEQWNDKENLNCGEEVNIRLRLGENLRYTKDRSGLGASLEIVKDPQLYPIYFTRSHSKGVETIREIIRSQAGI